GDAAEHRPRAVQDAQRALHLDGEVHVTGRVDDVDRVVDAIDGPVASDSGGGDGDPPLLLLLHPVGDGGTVVDLTDLVAHAGVVEDPLGGRRLARVDVGHDPDVPDPGQVK